MTNTYKEYTNIQRITEIENLINNIADEVRTHTVTALRETLEGQSSKHLRAYVHALGVDYDNLDTFEGLGDKIAEETARTHLDRVGSARIQPENKVDLDGMIDLINGAYLGHYIDFMQVLIAHICNSNTIWDIDKITDLLASMERGDTTPEERVELRNSIENRD